MRSHLSLCFTASCKASKLDSLFNGLGNNDSKADDDLPSSGTIFPVRGIQKDHELIVFGGPYSVVRHPSYTLMHRLDIDTWWMVPLASE